MKPGLLPRLRNTWRASARACARAFAAVRLLAQSRRAVPVLRAASEPACTDLAVRRRLLPLPIAAAAAGLGALLGRVPTARAGRLHQRRHAWGMVIDLDRCSGCGACAVACRAENNVPVLGPDPKNQGARIEWMSMFWRDGEQPGSPPELLPFPCQHCEEAPCTKVCPVGATYRDPEGFTAQIWERCIGCRYCMSACPYSRRSFNWVEAEWPGTMIQMLNPDVATRTRGVVEKCTFCNHRIQRAREIAALEGRDLTDKDLKRLPACASACPAGAITFGDHKDPKSTMARLSESPRAFRLFEHLGTKPRVVYLKRDRRIASDSDRDSATKRPR